MYLKSSQVYFKLNQLIGGTFPSLFLKKNQNNWHATGKRSSQNSGCQKNKFKIVWEKFQHRSASICSKLDTTLIFFVVVLLPTLIKLLCNNENSFIHDAAILQILWVFSWWDMKNVKSKARGLEISYMSLEVWQFHGISMHSKHDSYSTAPK